MFTDLININKSLNFNKKMKSRKEKLHLLKQRVLKSAILILSVLSVLLISACNKSEEVDNLVLDDENVYYVKYVITGRGSYGRFSNWTATTPTGMYSNRGKQIRGWSQTFGPVEQGFKCQVEIGDIIGGVPTIEIHVSRNEEPFALKVTRTSQSASYTIN